MSLSLSFSSMQRATSTTSRTKTALSFLLLCCATATANADEALVNIPNLGSVQGLLNPLAREFHGIPFGAPPVNELRWNAPQHVIPWSPTILDASKDQAGCVQNCLEPPHACPATVSEDCLYLNIFTPRLSQIQAPLPVLLFIHGGNFKDGFAGGPLYNSSEMVSSQNILVITVQYRLGALGFAYTNTGDTTNDLPGNLGLLDQSLAMQWVKTYISAFGGNGSAVTIWGQSAGAMSVASHMIAPSSRGLFAGAFTDSEPFALPFRKPVSANAIAQELMYYAGCSNDLACLRAAPVDTILAAQIKAQANLTADLSQLLQAFMPWCPTVDTEVLPNWPLYSFQGLPNTAPVADVPLVTGTVSSEGTLFIYSGFGKSNMSVLEYDLIIDVIFPWGDQAAIEAQYPVPPNPPTTIDLRPLASNLTTAGIFRCATRNASLELASSTSSSISTSSSGRTSGVWLYEYSHVLSFGHALWNETSPFCWNEVCHGEDLPMWFHPDYTQFGAIFTPEENSLSLGMRDYIGAFVRTGDPGTGHPNRPQPLWPRVGSTPQLSRAQFDVPMPVMETNDPGGEECALFDSMGYTWY